MPCLYFVVHSYCTAQGAQSDKIMEFLKNRVWLITFVLIAVGLYPIQKYLIKNDKLRKGMLTEITLGSGNYAINEPDLSLTLPSYLGEISGLSLSQNDTTLLAIQDEEGQVFFVHKQDGSIAQKIKFAGQDDYEGIELVEDQIFVTNNKGDVYSYPYPNDSVQPAKQAHRQKTFLNSDDNIEGLGYDAISHGLLLASKNSRKKGSTTRDIYRFDIAAASLDSSIYLTLDSKAILEMLGRKKKSTIFSPSALAIHPTTGHLYVVSSPASSIVIVSKTGKLLEAVELDRGVHRQPEGIVFDHDGTLYISNEGRNGLAKIHRFNRRKN